MPELGTYAIVSAISAGSNRKTNALNPSKLSSRYFRFIISFVAPNDRIQGLAVLQQPTWINQESKFERLNFGKPRW
jgi:hypothetical protein